MQKQCDRLLGYLKVNREIDPLTAWSELGIYRLGARVYDLRQAGHNITSDRKPVENRFGEECRVALYTLEDAA